MRKLLYLFILLILPAQICFGWSSGHAIITPPAVAVLPQWEQDIWSSVSPVNYSYNCDNFLSAGCTTAQSIAPYMYGETGGVYNPPVAACDPGSQTSIYHYFSWTSGSLNAYLKRGAKWYLEQAVQAFHDGDINATASLLGSYTHAMQDATSPYHCLDGLSGTRSSLWPDSNFGGANFIFWALSDGGFTVDISGYIPSILGTTIDSAAQAAADRAEEVNAYSRSLLPAFVAAHQNDAWESGGSGAATDAVMKDMGENDAKFLADFYHTAFYLAFVAPEPWKFIVVCDSRGTGTGADAINQPILTEIVTEILAEAPDLVVFPGDLVNGVGGTQAGLLTELTLWMSIVQPIYDANIGMYPIRGNHDVGYSPTQSPQSWDTIFSGDYLLPQNGPTSLIETVSHSNATDQINLTYSLDHKNAFFVALDNYLPGNRVDQGWLDTQFAGNTRPHVFVYGHEMAFKVHHTDMLTGGGPYAALGAFVTERDAFWESIKDASGRTYFVGHDHFYNHARIDDGDGDIDNDIHQFVVGTAGASPYAWSGLYDGFNSTYTPVKVYHNMDSYSDPYGYQVIEVDGGDVTLTFKQRISAGNYVAVDTWSYNIDLNTPKASNPNPANNATDLSHVSTVLKWDPAISVGGVVYSHDVYLGTNQQDVANASTTITMGVYEGNIDVNSYDPDIQELTQYYWRIDEVNGSDIWKGPVWNFATGIDPRIASNPNPYDTEKQIPLDSAVLSWIPGDQAGSHRIYFGTSEAAVTDAVYPEGDVDANGVVNYDDVAAVVDWWLADLGAAGAGGGTLIVAATDDAEVDSAMATTAKGATNPSNNWDEYMFVTTGIGAGKDGYFMFDISAIPADQVVTSATLTTKIHKNESGGGDNYFYSVANDSWDEQTITWNNRPAPSASAIASVYVNGTGEGGTPGQPQVDDHDVTAYVAASYAGADDLISFAYSGANGSFIRSKEDSLVRDIPSVELTVEYAPAPVIPVPYPDISCEGDVDLLDFAYVANDWQEDAASISVYQGTQNLDANTYSPGTLIKGTYYYWRIDEVNQCDVWEGDVWEFKSFTLTR